MRDRFLIFYATHLDNWLLAELQIVAEIGPIVDGLNISYKTHTMVYVIPFGITIEKQ